MVRDDHYQLNAQEAAACAKKFQHLHQADIDFHIIVIMQRAMSFSLIRASQNIDYTDAHSHMHTKQILGMQ